MSGSFTRKAWRGGWACLSALVLSLSGIATVEMTPAQAARSACTGTMVSGTAIGAGAALGKHMVAVVLHDSGQVLASTRTNRTGNFGAMVCASERLQRYASKHNGHLNLDLIVQDNKKSKPPLWLRTISPAYGTPSAVVPGEFVVAQAARRNLDSGAKAVAGLPGLGSELVSPSVMFVEVVPHISAQMSVSGTSVQSTAASVGLAGGGFGVSGEMAIDNSKGFKQDLQLKPPNGSSFASKMIQPTLKVETAPTCVNMPWSYGAAVTSYQYCYGVTSGAWTGDIKRPSAEYMPCTAGGSTIRVNSRDNRGFSVSSGSMFSSKVKVSYLATSLTVSTVYDADTSLNYSLEQGDKLHKFCVGGNGETVASSSQLYISYIPKGSGGGSANCRGSRVFEVIPCETP